MRRKRKGELVDTVVKVVPIEGGQISVDDNPPYAPVGIEWAGPISKPMEVMTSDSLSVGELENAASRVRELAREGM